MPPSPALELTDCPACGGRDARELADAEEVRAELEALWAFHSARLAPGTPPERLADRVAFSQRPPWRVVGCAACGTVYRNPRERSWEVEATYAGEAVDAAALEALFETQRDAYRAQAARLVEVAGREAGRGLEVGSYVGGFLAAAAERGWRVEGLDINERAAAFARSKGHAVTIGTLERSAPGHAYDAVAIWNCLDQLPDPRRAVARAAALLAPGGTLALRVPNGAFYAALRPVLRTPLRRVARALLAHSNFLGFPYRHAFTPSSLARLVREAGLGVVRRHGDALVPIADEWTRRWAAAEEWAVKRLLRGLGAADVDRAPWFELYARAGSPPREPLP